MSDIACDFAEPSATSGFATAEREAKSMCIMLDNTTDSSANSYTNNRNQISLLRGSFSPVSATEVGMQDESPTTTVWLGTRTWPENMDACKV